MNHRVLELLKNPKSIQAEDLHLLKEEINAFPYIQNIRALHLYGIHLYDKENYQKELSTTAAYTTDKKILYQLINGKIQSKPNPEKKKEALKYNIRKNEDFPNKNEEKSDNIAESQKAEVCPLPTPEIRHVYVNGVRNRILFEGEENFLNDGQTETIDLASTQESGYIVIQKMGTEVKESPDENINDNTSSQIVINDKEISEEQAKAEVENSSDVSFQEIKPFMAEVEIHRKEEEKEIIKERVEAGAEFTPEKIIDENKIDEEKKSIRDDEELSFHGMESFLPNVKIQSGNGEEIKKAEVPKLDVNKHEEEMRRLIAEVERKMKANKSSVLTKNNEPEASGHEISFAETQSFPIEPENKKKEQESPGTVQPEISQAEQKVKENNQPVAEKQEVTKTAWKPMTFESHLPDSLINKPIENQSETEIPQAKVQEEKNIKQENILLEIKDIPELIEDHSENFGEAGEAFKVDIQAPIIDEPQEEARVMNVSFFGSDISSWKKESDEEKTAEHKAEQEKTTSNTIESNVPGFINTWQNWLKIDRTQEPEKSKVETKIKVIDAFIENNPKISQLKEESNYVVKEKTGDISHLMTETLANLYVEQKLYTKAIKAFEVLINKNPEKKEYFEKRIQEIKDFKSKG